MDLNKSQFRQELKKAREELSFERRQDAARDLLRNLSQFLSNFQAVLSFSSFDTEIDTSLLNLYLARTQRLLLPKMEGESLKIYRVEDLDRQLTPNNLGILEPIHCEEVDLKEIEIILVPGLGFDRKNHRIGYGRGHYDRLIAKASQCPTIGIGFREQLVETLPTEESDHPLMNISLF